MSDRVSQTSFVYHVDADDRIVHVSSRWEAFARANGAPELAGEAVIGRPLLDFVSGLEAQEIYLAVLARVRASRRVVSLPFRCDAPGVRRFMVLEVVPSHAGGLSFVSRLTREEPRPSQPLVDATVRRGGGLLNMCSWCKRVALDSGRWLEVEEAVSRLRLFEQDSMPEISHGVCNDCARGVRERLAGLRR